MGRMKDTADAPGDHLVGPTELLARGRYRREIGIGRAEIVVADRSEQFEVLVDLDLIEAVNRVVRRDGVVRQEETVVRSAIGRIDRSEGAGPARRIGWHAVIGTYLGAGLLRG